MIQTNNNNYNPDVLTCLANLSNDEVFTPPVLVNKILDQLPISLWSDSKATFLDPVSKTGVFLREIAKRLIIGLETEMPDLQTRIDHIYQKQLFALALTDLTALMSRRTVYCSKYANGKYAVTSFDDEQGNIIYKPQQHTWHKGKCTFCGASQAEYDRPADAQNYAYQFIHSTNPEDLFNMKFDVIAGNPPYQLSDGGNGSSAMPLYHKFVQQAKKMNPRYLTMFIPARWFAGGKGLDEFRSEMLNDNSVREITDYINAKDCFPGISIGGGVCYFLWDRDNKGDCRVTSILNGKESILTRKLNQFSIFVRFNQAIEIINKVSEIDFNPLSKIINSRNPFGISSSERGGEKEFKDSIKLHSSKGVGFIKIENVAISKDLVNKFKVLISKVTGEHAGEPDKNGQFKIISRMAVLHPNEVCTDSYLIAGSFSNELEANNLCQYIQTRFVRFLLLQAVSSINLSKDKFNFIPIQEFKESWTDEKLYKKYGLTEDEIAFIESMIKPME